MFPTKVFSSLGRDELMALVANLQDQVARLQQQVVQLTAANEELRKETTELKRAGKRRQRRSPKEREGPIRSALAASLGWDSSATENRRLPMRSPSCR